MTKPPGQIGAGTGTLIIIVSVLLISLFVVWNSSKSSSPTAPTPQTLGQNERAISSAGYGDRWPFTFAAGVLRCTNSVAVNVTDSASNQTYAVNGAAKSLSTQTGWGQLDQVWRDDPAGGLKVNIGPMIQDGLTLCN